MSKGSIEREAPNAFAFVREAMSGLGEGASMRARWDALFAADCGKRAALLHHPCNWSDDEIDTAMRHAIAANLKGR